MPHPIDSVWTPEQLCNLANSTNRTTARIARSLLLRLADDPDSGVNGRIHIDESGKWSLVEVAEWIQNSET